MWTTIDEEGNEHLTKVHQVECGDQRFSRRKKQFVCNKDKELCNENCPFYSELKKYNNDYEELPNEGIEIDTSIIWSPRHNDIDNFISVDENLDIIDDSRLLNYLQTEIWNY
jgi:hypothetical protein